ncbi:hypothetical protein HOC35_00910 [Candidatus Woesearchaeota archaeon]|nr:hypothetical protein [Candidatus Woesearchaeota archaeon]
MAKKRKSMNKDYSMYLLAIVGIVAVVGVVFMMTNSGTTTVSEAGDDLVVSEDVEDGDLTGEAYSRKYSRIKPLVKMNTYALKISKGFTTDSYCTFDAPDNCLFDPNKVPNDFAGCVEVTPGKCKSYCGNDIYDSFVCGSNAHLFAKKQGLDKNCYFDAPDGCLYDSDDGMPSSFAWCLETSATKCKAYCKSFLGKEFPCYE